VQPLTIAELEARLDQLLELDLVRLSPEQAAAELAVCRREQQESALYWSGIAGKAHTQIGYQVSLHANLALGCMDDEVMGRWVYHALDLYDRKGLLPALAAVRAVEQYAQEADARARGVIFDETAAMLNHFLQGLSGRSLTLEEGEVNWTDSEKIYLPPFLGHFEQQVDNAALYKAQLVMLWAENRYGSWRLVEERLPQSRISQWLGQQPQPAEALERLQRLEAIRIHAILARQFPGLHREMRRLLTLQQTPLVPPEWASVEEPLCAAGATLESALDSVQRVINTPMPERLCYQGVWQIDALHAVVATRIEKERGLFQYRLWKMLREMDLDEEATEKQPLGWRRKGGGRVDEPLEVELLIEEQPVTPPEVVSDLMTSIIQDFGDLPPHYLHPAGPGAFNPKHQQKRAQDVWGGTYHEEGAFLYDEWDGSRLNYRKGWAVLREMEAKVGEVAFVECTLKKYHRLVSHLRKSFERLRSADQRLKRQQYGDNVDLDAMVDAVADHLQGQEMSERLYLQNRRHERSIAVMLMVDMSGSTKGWINDAERESLVLLCEALEMLNDQYAIYGFSGWSRKRCEVFPIKRFSDAYDERVRARIAGIEAKDYTRMGVAIRHLTSLLNEADARTRILVTLSDGKPDDSDGYKGEYAIEDTRMALLEARRSGIHPFCITIDKEGQAYLPHMYGPTGYTVVDAVEKLPFKVANIYRRLTL
jgi:nitric oxide reductase NorD protein